ncbi:ABC transporter permease [Paenibacillus bouchesdurhonensis]|uniref:ABC transporter permease n=1 Tax=Paenibacillus bouchesdurhonensis TaxID=1870990 RepID=UPI000DA62012|nr:ABC transporter permease [Paenibacillus bouchesdurhonensis]
MRRIRTFLEILYRQFISDRKVNLVILCILTLAFSFLFLISKEVIQRFAEYGELNESVRTYEIRFSGINSVKSFDFILKEFSSNNIEKIKHINLSIRNNEISHLDLIFTSNYRDLYPQSMGNRIIQGRNFTENEIDTGEDVIILSQSDYSEFYSNYNLGDVIDFSGYDFELIGISRDDNKTSSVIPYSTILKISQYNNNPFRMNEAFITLEERLSKKEIRKMIKAAKNNDLNDAEIRIITSSSWMIVSKLENISGGVMASLIVIFFSVLNVFKMIKILHLRNKNIMMIYRNLGYEDVYIILNFVVEIFILIMISIIVGNYISIHLGPIIKSMSFI